MSRPISGAFKFIGIGILIGSLGGAGWYLIQARNRGSTVEPTRLFEQVLSHVRNFGVDSLGEAEIYRRAAEGLVRELDDEYAALIPAGGSVNGPADPGGLGLMLYVRGDRALVQSVLPGSPAERAGVMPGDQILTVGAGPPTGIGREAVLQTFEGPPGSVVEVGVRRPGIRDVLQFSMRREVPRDHFLSENINLGRGVAYLAIGLVGPNLPHDLRLNLLDLPPSTGGLVVDLRGATGGDVEDAAAIAEFFLDRGDPIASVRGRGDVVEEVVAERRQLLPDLAITVLVDGATADAAEALAGALQDNDRALIIGRPTFGRGSSHDDYPLGDRWIVRMSTARWETPSGRRLEPDSSGAPRDSIRDRPVFTTGEGRVVLGGGGIVPDSLVAIPRPSAALQAFYRILGPAIPDFVDVMLQAAGTIAASRVVPGLVPTEGDLDLLTRLLAQKQISVPSGVLEEAWEEIRVMLGVRAVTTRLGFAGRVRRMVVADGALRLAVGLLRGVSTPRELVLGR